MLQFVVLVNRVGEKANVCFCCLFFLANAAQAACTNSYPRETVSLYTRWVRQEFYSGVYLSITLSCVFFVRPSLHGFRSSGSSYTLTWPPVVWLAQHWWRTVVSCESECSLLEITELLSLNTLVLFLFCFVLFLTSHRDSIIDSQIKYVSRYHALCVVKLRFTWRWIFYFYFYSDSFVYN